MRFLSMILGIVGILALIHVDPSVFGLTWIDGILGGVQMIFGVSAILFAFVTSFYYYVLDEIDSFEVEDLL